MTEPKKKWWQSTTIFSGIGSIAVGIFLITQGGIETGIASIVTGVGAILGRVTATKEIAGTSETPKAPEGN